MLPPSIIIVARLLPILAETFLAIVSEAAKDSMAIRATKSPKSSIGSIFAFYFNNVNIGVIFNWHSVQKSQG
jgi:hypothetical protein